MTNHDIMKLRPKSELVIILEDLDFSWYAVEMNKVKSLWKDGWHIKDIAKTVKRDQDEVATLVMHLARRGEISRRRGGVFGDDIYC